MNWLFRTLSTSVGKKQLMAVTGLLFLLFLATHLLGNLSVYGAPPPPSFPTPSISTPWETCWWRQK